MTAARLRTILESCIPKATYGQANFEPNATAIGVEVGLNKRHDPGLYMRGFFGRMRLCAVCLMGLALLSPVAAQSPVDQQTAGGIANIYNLDRAAHVGGVEIQGPIDRAVTSQAIELIGSIRPDVDELTVLLNSGGGDVFAAMELGEEIRNQWALTAVDDDGQCLGACVLVLAAGVRRTPAPEKVGLQRLNFEQTRDRAKQKHAGLAKSVEAYLARMGMPKRLFQEIRQQPSERVLFLDAQRLKALGLNGTDPAYEQWLRANNYQQPLQSD